MSQTQATITRSEDYRVFLLVYRDETGNLVETDFLDLCDGGMDPLSTPEVDRNLSINQHQIAVFEYLEGFEDADGTWKEPITRMCTLSTSHPQKTESSERVYTAKQFVATFSGILFKYLISLLPQAYVVIGDDVAVDFSVLMTLKDTNTIWN